MNETLIRLGEALPLPDAVTRTAIRYLVGRTRGGLAGADAGAERRFAAGMDDHPIALHTEAANGQHYELPAEFFETVLGPRRKYSCCLFETAEAGLAEAEDAALTATAAHARLADGQTILELGCGWGSLSIWMAQHYPNASITAVSNSHSQRRFIAHQARTLGLGNLDVRTADMNEFVPQGRFDRIVSVEMFEHMANWRPLLARLKSCLVQDGLLFLHVFSHRRVPYRFDHTDKTDWIAQHFFTGGIMPSHSLIGAFDDLFAVEAQWRWNGQHYERTAAAWLANFDARTDTVNAILHRTYGADWRIWRRRWRLFFLATMGLFGHANGEEWGISHHLLRPA